MNSQFHKDPEAVLDYRIDWSLWLDNDTISSSSWNADEGITVVTLPPPMHDDTTATVWLSGGEAGVCYRVTNHIVTAGGRADDRTLTIRVSQR